MSTKTAVVLTLLSLLGGSLRAESSEYPLGINLPTAERMQYWDISIAFTHRFESHVQGHSKDLYGLDGYAYPAFGFDFGIKPVPGLNFQIYRTADNKTLTFALQQQILDKEHIRLGIRVERFGEGVEKAETPLGSVGISGGAFQVPTDIFILDNLMVTLVPTYLTRTTTQEKGVFNVGAGLRVDFTENFCFMGEYYPRPSKIEKTYKSGWAAGFSYKTFKHRFTLIGTNTVGTTTNQVLGGDYGGGPGYYGPDQGGWSLGFNVVRVF